MNKKSLRNSKRNNIRTLHVNNLKTILKVKGNGRNRSDI
jgi:hypothetical protein